MKPNISLPRKYLQLQLLLLLFLTGAFYFLPGKNNSSQSKPLFRSNAELFERTDAPLRALRQEFQKMMDPFIRTVPMQRLKDAELYALQANRGEGVSTMAWQERGPSNIGGRTRSILVDQSDATGNKVFAGSVGGGLWVTTNFKNASPTWTKVNDLFSNLAITCMKQSPVSNSIMYFGTGEGWGNIDAIQGGGIYKSTDGGANWNLLASSTGFSFVEDLEFDNNGYIYASTRATSTAQRGIMRSTDGGTTWVQVLVDPIAGVTTRGADLERAADGDMYATLGIFSTGHVFRSAANGVNTGISGSWTEITPPGITTNAYQRVELAVCPNDVNRIYAIAQDDATFGIGALYRSDNDGTTWTTLTNPTWCDQGASVVADFSRTQAWYDLILAVDPNNSSLCFAGGVVLEKTTNAGTAWTQASRWTSGATCTTAPVIHADIHEIEFLNSSEMIVATDGGIFYSTDGGASYVSKNIGYNVTQYYGMALNKTSGSNFMLAGAQDNGSHEFTTSGINTVTQVTGGDGGFCFIDTTNTSVWITSNPGGYFNIYRSNGTLLGTAGSGNGRFISAADYASVLNVLYFGDADGKYVRVTNVESGTASVGTNNFSTDMGANRQVSCIKIDPADETTIWLGCSDSENNTGTPVTPILLKVLNANQGKTGAPPNATATAFAGPTLPAGSYISNIDIEPGNSNHMILSVANFGVTSVWESTDGGTNWTSVEGNLPDMPVRWAMFIPSGYHARTNAIGGVMLATELGVWSTTTLNGASTLWVSNNSGLANVRTDQLLLRPSDKTVAAATHGRGVFTTTLLTNPLPVTLTDFSGIEQGPANLLKWQTSSEYNSDHFDLERSEDGVNYRKLVTIPAAGMSNSILNYSYADRDLRTEVNYYRLRQVDFNGQAILSHVVQLKSNTVPQKLYVRTNPFRDFVGLSFFRVPSSPVKLRLIDQGGRVVGERIFSAGNAGMNWQLPGSLAMGIYILDVKTGTDHFSRQLLKN